MPLFSVVLQKPKPTETESLIQKFDPEKGSQGPYIMLFFPSSQRCEPKHGEPPPNVPFRCLKKAVKKSIDDFLLLDDLGLCEGTSVFTICQLCKQVDTPSLLTKRPHSLFLLCLYLSVGVGHLYFVF